MLPINANPLKRTCSEETSEAAKRRKMTHDSTAESSAVSTVTKTALSAIPTPGNGTMRKLSVSHEAVFIHQEFISNVTQYLELNSFPGGTAFEKISQLGSHHISTKTLETIYNSKCDGCYRRGCKIDSPTLQCLKELNAIFKKAKQQLVLDNAASIHQEFIYNLTQYLKTEPLSVVVGLDKMSKLCPYYISPKTLETIYNSKYEGCYRRGCKIDYPTLVYLQELNKILKKIMQH